MSELTMDEAAAAFKAGAEAMREAAIEAVRAVQVPEDAGAIEGYGRFAALAEAFLAIRALPLPEPPASLQADGLCGRGA